MANVIFDSAKEAFLSGDIDMLTDTIRAVLIDTGTYTFNAAHDNYDDLTGIVGTESAALTGKTVTDGTFDADDISFLAVTGNTAEAIVLFKDTGNPATDALILYIDTATGLPVTPNGGDINVAWSASGIFDL